MTATTRDVYQQITDQIIAAMENGVNNWTMPWHRPEIATGRPTNIASGNAYRGVNVVALWVASLQHGFPCGLWGTYRQWLAKGAQVRKGERASLIVFYKEVTREADSTGGDEEHEGQRRMFARASWVFNVDQVDGFTKPEQPLPASGADVIDRAEHFVSATGAKIEHGGNRAYYDRLSDSIRLPERAAFLGSDTSSATEAYYGTIFHELTHYSGAPSRCNREFGKRFGDHAYAMEELVAELGAAFLCADLAVTNTPREDHAAYIANWLAVMREDKRAIFTAAAKASQAVDFLTGMTEPALH